MSEQTHHESDEAVIRKLEADNADLRKRVAELEGVADGWRPISWASPVGDTVSDRRIRIDAVTGAFYDGTKYAVRDGSMVLSKSGEWEYEPMPSSRDDDFYARCRFDTLAEAALAASKPAGDAEVAESAERMADKHDDTLRSLADGPHDHDHLAGGEGE